MCGEGVEPGPYDPSLAPLPDLPLGSSFTVALLGPFLSPGHPTTPSSGSGPRSWSLPPLPSRVGAVRRSPSGPGAGDAAVRCEGVLTGVGGASRHSPGAGGGRRPRPRE